MEQYKSFKIYFSRTKIVYTGIFFFLYMLYRALGCPVIGYLCGESLEFFVPVFFIGAYYTLIGGLRLMLRFFEIFDVNISKKKLTIIDLFAELLFYFTCVMLIYEEAWNPYFYFRTTIIISINFVFAFYIFRNGFFSRYKSSEDMTTDAPDNE